MANEFNDKVIVRTFKDHTQVQIGDRSLEVERRDTLVRENLCPMEYVSIGLGSCISMTIAAVAKEKQIAPEKIEVQVSRKTITNGLTSRERILLFNAARSCEVHQMLKGEKTFNFQLENPSSLIEG
jgi:uncharacterized OsmC-like protein